MMMMMMIMMMMMMMMMIALKGAIRDFFYNLLTAPRTVSNMYAQVARAQLCANHVPHIERSPRATYHVTCHVVGRDSSGIKYDKSLNRIYFSFILLAEHIWRKQRHQLWPQDESTANKLWGTARPAPHHPVHGNMWTEGLSTADRPLKKNLAEPLTDKS